MPRRLTIVALVPLFILSFGAAASAKKQAVKPKEAPPAEDATPPAEVEAASAEAEAQPGAEAVAEEAPAMMMTPVNQPQWGGAFRARWISLPSSFLGGFIKTNQSLSSYSVGLEGFRRKRDAENPNRFWEISLGLGYQNMSPRDGNWLGNGHNAAIDTDWVQFKNFAFWTIDLNFTQRQFFNDVFGIHYGAGLGLAIIQGDILRTKSYRCTDTEESRSTCRPIVCTGGVCTEAELAATQNGQPSTPADPHRYREGSVPGAIPIVNLLAGFDFRIPQAKGLEFRIDAGLFHVLDIFLGGAVGYVF
jgi:hypothetical protein